MTNEAEITGQVILKENLTSKPRIVQAPLNAKYVVLTVSAIKKGFQSGVASHTEEYLTFDIISGGTIYWKTTDNSFTKTISYSKDNGATWNSITPTESGTSISVESGDEIMFRGNNSAYSNVMLKNNRFSSSTGTKFNVRGNIMSLIDSNGFATAETLTDSYTFYSLFSGCKGLVSAENLILPATALTESCYRNMFQECSSLTTAPALPATTLADMCYLAMFFSCTSLTTAPELPATTLASKCYYSMFNDCTKLTTAPVLPANTLMQECYRFMLSDCTSLTTAPELPATILADGCYANMFEGCGSLTTAPVLPATTLVENCYREMFRGCTNLNHIKCLATDISASSCTYSWVFSVASTGTFVKNISMTGWATSVNGIPEGWAVENTATGSSIIVGTVSGGTIGLGTGCAANFNGSFTVSGSEVCTLTNSVNNIIVNGLGQFGWSSISYDEAKAVEFGYDWGGSYQYTNNCYLSLIITDGVNTVNGVIQKGSQSVTVDLTPFWANGTTEQITVTINATIN